MTMKRNADMFPSSLVGEPRFFTHDYNTLQSLDWPMCRETSSVFVPEIKMASFSYYTTCLVSPSRHRFQCMMMNQPNGQGDCSLLVGVSLLLLPPRATLTHLPCTLVYYGYFEVALIWNASVIFFTKLIETFSTARHETPSFNHSPI